MIIYTKLLFLLEYLSFKGWSQMKLATSLPFTLFDTQQILKMTLLLTWAKIRPKSKNNAAY